MEQQPCLSLATAAANGKRSDPVLSLSPPATISDARYRALAQATCDVLWVTTPDGDMQEQSASWQSFTGQEARHAAGRGWLQMVHSDDREALEKMRLQSLKDQQVHGLICRLHHVDGDYRALHIRGLPVLSADGRMSEWMCIGTVQTFSQFLNARPGSPAFDLHKITGSHRLLTAILQEEPVQLAMKAAGIGLWTWDATGQSCFLFNESAAEIFGLPANTVVSLDELLSVIHPDDYERVTTAAHQALKEDLDYVTEYRVIWPDRSIHWLTTWQHPLYGQDGVLIGAVGVVADLTERKLIEQRLQATNEHMTALLESITDGFFHFDTTWRCTYANEQAARNLQIPRDAFVGKYLWEFITEFGHYFERGGELFGQAVSAAMLNKESFSFESFVMRTQRWIVTQVYPISEGVVVYFHDITERKQTELALRASEAKFRRLFDANVIGVMLAGLDGRVLEANDALLSLFGYSREELARGQINWRALTPPGYCQQDAEKIEELIETRIAQPFEKEFFNKQGQRVPVLVAGALLEDRRDAAICYLLDMTAQKELEKQRNLMMSIVGHELRTPLTAISMSMQLAQRNIRRFERIGEKLTPEVEDILKKIYRLLEQSIRQTRVQNRLINDLLDSARVAVDKLELALEPCNLVSIVSETVQDVHATAPERQIELRLPSQDRVYVMADADRIGQVVSNYLTNAIKYAPAHAPVIVELKIEADRALVTVRDEGPGLSGEEQRHIWDRFYQVKGITDQSGSGVNLGLGLYICRVIIERHHGEVGVESTPGLGSTFWFSLPLASKKQLEGQG